MGGHAMLKHGKPWLKPITWHALHNMVEMAAGVL